MVVKSYIVIQDLGKVEKYDVRAVSGDRAYVPSFVKIEQLVPDFKRMNTSTNTHAHTRARVLITQVYFFLVAKERRLKGNYRKEDRERGRKEVLIHFCAPF